MFATPASAQVPEVVASQLRTEIAQAKSLRVIVGLATDHQRGDAGVAARQSQEELLTALQGTEHTIVLVFASSPLLALIVGSDALDVLLSHPSVTSIMLDRARRPTPGQSPPDGRD
jgi:hypothetical protein